MLGRVRRGGCRRCCRVSGGKGRILGTDNRFGGRINRQILWRRQHGPSHDHHKAEQRRQDEVLVLVVHLKPPISACKSGGCSTCQDPKGQAVFRSKRRYEAGERAENHACQSELADRCCNVAMMVLAASSCPCASSRSICTVAMTLRLSMRRDLA